MSQLAQRYAQAAWDVAQQTAVGEAMVGEFADFCAALDASPRLMQALVNPAFKNERAAVLRDLLATHEASPVTGKLLQLLLEHERMPLLGDVALALQNLADAAAGRMRAQVKLAVAAKPEQLQRIESILSQRMGKPVVLEVQVDADMVAGMVCRVGKLTFDSSLKQQLGHFAERAGATGPDQ